MKTVKIFKNLAFVAFTLLFFSQGYGQVNQIIDLSLNENPYGSSFLTRKLIIDETKQVQKYSRDEGKSLIKIIVNHEHVNEGNVILGDVLAPLGTYLSLRAKQGAEFIYSIPGYPVFADAAQSVGGKIIGIPLNANKENDLAAIKNKINSRTAAIYLINPHNPSGTLLDKNEFYTFLHSIPHHIVVIVDEAYLEYSDDFKARSAVNNLRQGDNVVVFRTFDKIYGLAGLSFGYALAPQQIVDYLNGKGIGDLFYLNRLSVAAAKAALLDSGRVKLMGKLNLIELNKWNKFLDKKGIKHTNSSANFIFIDLKRNYSVSSKIFASKGILIGRLFPPYNSWVRISIGLPLQNEKVRNVIDKYFLK